MIFSLIFQIESDLKYVPFLRQLFPSLKVQRSSALTQILIEGFNNAVIHAHKEDATKWVEISVDCKTTKKGEEVTLKIRDEGKGIPKENWKEKAEGVDLWSTSGRGLPLMRAYSDSLKSTQKGKFHWLEATCLPTQDKKGSKDPLEILHRLSLAITKATRIADIYALLLEEIVEALDVERASIMRLDPKENVLRIVAAKGIEEKLWKKIAIEVGSGVSGKVVKEGAPVLVRGSKKSSRYKSHSYMVAPVNLVPMQVGKNSIGVINLTDKRSGKPFTNDDLALLTILTNQAAAYMHLYDLTEKVQETERLRSQMEIARQIQQSLLPKATPSMKGIEVKGVLIPAERVSADYFDFFELGKEKIGICVADISGHTVGGAMLVTALRSTLRAMAMQGKAPKQVVTAVNKIHYQDLLRSEQFLSLVYAEYDQKKKELRYCNAGHPPPLLWRSKKKKHELLSTKDFIVGLDNKLSFHEEKVKLAKGDVIIFYTDGLIEAKNKKGDAFGEKKLLQTLKKSGSKSVTAILNDLLLNWKTFIGKSKPKDDVTLVVLKHA